MSRTNGHGEPLPTGHNGREPGGRFAPGNKFARGNPNNARAQRLRNATIRAVTRADMRDVMLAMLDRAKAGEVSAAVFVRDTTIGKPVPADVMERIEALESAIKEPRR